jgi:hypothetical protein
VDWRGPGRLCRCSTQPPRLRPPLPVGIRPRSRYPAGRGPSTVASTAGPPIASAAGWPGGACGPRRGLGRALCAGGPR